VTPFQGLQVKRKKRVQPVPRSQSHDDGDGSKECGVGSPRRWSVALSLKLSAAIANCLCLHRRSRCARCRAAVGGSRPHRSLLMRCRTSSRGT
jgi:hypothetical protein